MSMPIVELIFLALALSVDAFIVAFSYGLILRSHRFNNGLKLAIATGLGQFIMPIIGYLLTGSIYHIIKTWDHWIGFSVFCLLGINVIREGWQHRNNANNEPQTTNILSLLTLINIGIATSIDALVAGVSIYLDTPCATQETPCIGLVFYPASFIGITTFLCTALGFFLAKKLHRFPTFTLELGAGLILIALGCKMLIEHTC